jgi:hypothetical protein
MNEPSTISTTPAINQMIYLKSKYGLFSLWTRGIFVLTVDETCVNENPKIQNLIFISQLILHHLF